MDDVEAVLQFWFGQLDARGCADSTHSARWWKKDPAFDALIEERFGTLHAAVAAGARDAWLGTDRGTLAYVIVLDQFSRNMFRGTARAFSYDAQALAAAVGAIDRGVDRRLALDERTFVYMPLMHSEDIAAQDRCVALFSALRAAAPVGLEQALARSLDYARRHRDIIARFGRFPHRNAILGRTSTFEEVEFLAQPGSAF